METKIEEVWEIIPLPQLKSIYSVSNIGRVRNNRTGRILKHSYDRRGYDRITFSVSTEDFKFYVHRLVLISFKVPNSDNKSDVNHINGNPSDNRLINLEWATRMENIHHACSIGLMAAGRGNVFLNREKVLEIRSKHKPGVSGCLHKIAEEYGLEYKHVAKIIYREIWKFI